MKTHWCMVGYQVFIPVPYIFSSSLSGTDKGWSLTLQGLQDMTWVVLSLLNVWIPLIIFIFTLTSTVSMGRRHQKYPCKKLHSCFRTQAIWKISYIVIHSFCNVIHTVSCVPVAKVNHVIPCLIMM